MMQLIIEGLKPKYESLEKVILNSSLTEDEVEEKLCTLSELCRIIVCCTTTYEGMPAPQLAMNIEQDLRFVSGKMTEEEEQARIKFHWDLIEQRDRELREYMELQRQERGKEKK